MLPQWVLNPWTSNSKSNTLLSELIWHVLLRRSLNFCSCNTWFLELNDLVRINKTWLYKKLSLTSKCQVSPEWIKLVQDLEWIRGPGVQYTLGVTFCFWIILFPRSKASDANNANFGSFEKPLIDDMSYSNKWSVRFCNIWQIQIYACYLFFVDNWYLITCITL